jgi:ABC-type uncharacterized transport system permease subunit
MLFTFWVLDVTAFYMIKNIIIQLIAGALIPLNLFPESILSVLKFCPFYYTFYYPVSLYLTNDLSGVLQGFIVLSISISLTYVLIKVTYRFASKAYEGVSI